MGPCKKKLIAIVICGVILIILGSVLGFSVFPSVIDDTVDQNVWLAHGTPQYERFVTLPFPLSFKVYLFNITNLDEIRATGAKPVIDEVGPYVYDEYLIKKNIKFNYITNTIEFEQHRLFYFNTELSVTSSGQNLTEQDVLNVVHVPMVSVQQVVVEQLQSLNPSYIPFIDEGLPLIFAKQEDPFMSISVKKYLWEGIKICENSVIQTGATTEVRGFAQLVCLGMRLGPPIKNIEDFGTYMQFSFMKYKNNTHDGVFVVHNGVDDPALIGNIISWQGMGYTKFWNPNKTTCDKVHGWDSTIYPPHLDEASVFDIYATDICRTSKLAYVGEMEYEGIKGLRYEVDKNAFASPSTASENECYCINKTLTLNSEAMCHPDGFVDMYGCQGAPILVSFPHMLWGDNTYYNSTIGQDRSEALHTNYVELEPNTGSPLRGVKRAQFNAVLRYLDHMPITTAMFKENPSVMPILWVDEGMELPQYLVDEIKTGLLSAMVIIDAVTWTLISLGILFVCLSLGGLYYLHKKGLTSKSSKSDIDDTAEKSAFVVELKKPTPT